MNRLLLLLVLAPLSCHRECGKGSDAHSRPVDAAIQWIAAHRDRAPGKGTRCDDDGFCAERVALPDVTIMSIAHKDDAKSFLYSLFVAGDFSCDHFGAHRVVREWESSGDYVGNAQYHNVDCELHDPSLVGLRARFYTVRGADPQLDGVAHLYVYSPTPAVLRRLERDEASADAGAAALRHGAAPGRVETE